MSDDRLDAIKKIVGATNPGFFVSLPPDAARYLIGEVERLRIADGITRDFAAMFDRDQHRWFNRSACCVTVNEAGRADEDGGYHGKECPWMRARHFAESAAAAALQEPE